MRVAGGRNQAEAELIQGMLLEEGVPSMLRRSAGLRRARLPRRGPARRDGARVRAPRSPASCCTAPASRRRTGAADGPNPLDPLRGDPRRRRPGGPGRLAAAGPRLAPAPRPMDFAPSDRVTELLDRVRAFMEEHVDPVEAEAHAGVRRGGQAGRSLRADRRRAARAGARRGSLEPVPSRRPVRPRAHQLGVRDALRAHGPQRRGAHGLQLRRARHGQRGDPRRARHRGAEGALAPAAARRRDPQLLLDDRAGDLGLRPHAARRARRAGRRRVGRERPQVVHLGLQRRLDRHRHGGDRPRRAAAQAREHDPRPDRHARASRASGRCR